MFGIREDHSSIGGYRFRSSGANGFAIPFVVLHAGILKLRCGTLPSMCAAFRDSHQFLRIAVLV